MLTILPDDLHVLVNVLFEAVVILFVVILLTRLNGLRSFSKQSAFDFPITVATGSVIATTIAGQGTPLAVGIVAAAALFAVQAVIAFLRVRIDPFERLVDNRPLLLMEGGRIIDSNLLKARMSRDDLVAKLRAASVTDLAQVRAVVFETTADVSVMTGPPGTDIEPLLLQGVRRG